MYDIDKQIKKMFKLFQGVRSEKEDKKIYEKVTDLIFKDLVSFLVENTTTKDKPKLKKEISSKKKIESREKVLLDHLSKIKDVQKRLPMRIDYFLKALVVNSFRGKKDAKTRRK